MRTLLTCAYNMDNCCVELKFTDGSMIAIDTIAVEKALQISKAGAYNLLNDPDFPTLRIGGRKLVMKNELVEWLKSRTNGKV